MFEADGCWEEAYKIWQLKNIIQKLPEDPSYPVMKKIYQRENQDEQALADAIAGACKYYHNKNGLDKWKLACNIVYNDLTQFSKCCVGSKQFWPGTSVSALLDSFEPKDREKSMNKFLKEVVPQSIIQVLQQKYKSFNTYAVGQKAELLLNILADELADKIYKELQDQGIANLGQEKQIKSDIINKHHCNLSSVQQAMEQEKGQKKLIEKLGQETLAKARTIYESDKDILGKLNELGLSRQAD